MAPAPVLLAVDGDGLLHRAHHAMAIGPKRDDRGNPVWALYGLLISIAAIAARVRPDGLIVGFDSPDSLRRDRCPDYKAHRPPKPADLQAQLAAAPALLANAGVPVVSVSGYEADDVLATAAARARATGWTTTLVTSDRDLLALVDESTSLLRVQNGRIDDAPVLSPDAVHALAGVRPDQYRDLAALRGDPSDNLRGATGVGAATAARLLGAFGSLAAVWQALDSGQEGPVAAVVGDVIARRLAEPDERDRVRRNLALMTMHADLPVSDLPSLRLPLDGARLRTTLAAAGVRLGRSLWALVGEDRPIELPPGFDRAPHYLPRVEPPPRPAASPTGRRAIRPMRRAAPAPVSAGQLSLF